MSLLQSAALLGALASSVAAHGYVQGFVGGGLWYEGYSPSFQYYNPAPVVIGWSDPEDLDNGFVAPSNFSSSDIICHKGATNAGTHATVAAGSKVEMQWTTWPDSHHGPVLSYLAKCDGACEDVDKTALEFFKIDEVGLVDDSAVPGTWASDQLIANNNSWVTIIPSDIAAGNYVLRHEIIALHGAESTDGAQNYPQCFNLKVTGGGSATPAGEKATAFYKSDDPGILVNIYQTLSSYTIPGPTLYSGATIATQTTLPFSGAAAVASASVAASSAAAVSSAPAETTAVVSSTAAVSVVVASTPAASTPAPVASSAAYSTPVAASTPAVTPSPVAPDSSAAPVVSSPAAYSAVPSVAPIISQIGNLTTALPSGILTSVIGTGALPSATGGVTVPSSELPDGFTVQDLLEWLAWVMRNLVRGNGKGHARDFHHER